MTLGELPAGWSWKTVADVAHVAGGLTKHAGRREDSKEVVPLVSVAAVRLRAIDRERTSTIGLLPEDGDTGLLTRGDVLVVEGNGSLTHIGRVALWADEVPGARHQNHIIRVRPHGVHPSFLLEWLASPRGRDAIISEATSASGLYTLSLTKVSRLPVPVPPLDVQRRIVAKLDQLLAQSRAAREQLEAVPALVEQYRQSVLAAAFRGDLTKEWRVARGESEDRWVTTPLETVVDDIRYGTAKKCHLEARGRPVLRIPNVVNGTVSHDELKYAIFDHKELQRLSLSEGDLLVIRSNGSVDLVGRVALVSKRENGFLFAGYLIRLRVDAAKVDSRFIAQMLSAPQVREVVQRLARSSSGVNNINSEEIMGLKVPVPSLEEQHQALHRIDGLLSSLPAMELAVENVDQLERSLLAKAFRGELDLDGNDAEVVRLPGRHLNAVGRARTHA